MPRVAVINLGCPRNLVDSEVMIGLLEKSGYIITEDFDECDVAVINTCAFVEDAKKESIDLILRVIELKKEHKVKAIIVTGCLPQRYFRQLKKELIEVDAFLGTNNFIRIPETVQAVLSGSRPRVAPGGRNFLYDHTYPRSLITPKHSVYVKLAEGCNNVCSYCVIPKIRGRLRSRSSASIIKEIRDISKGAGISEINLIGQDITLYGTDLYGAAKLGTLLKKVAGLKAARWIRLLYTHPAHYTDELIEVVKDEPSVCRYLDIPLQHINDRILKLMNRRISKREIINLIERLRREIPGLCIRTTFLVGFPTETDAEFKELMAFVKERMFERLGVFEYSREEGTKAYKFRGHISAKAKNERFNAVMKLQQEVSKEVNAKFLGRELTVLVDEVDDKPVTSNKGLPDKPGTRDTESKTYICRTEYDAPEVDGQCFVTTDKLHVPGEFVKIRVIDTLEYDLVGEEI